MHIFRKIFVLLFIATAVTPINTAQSSLIDSVINFFSSEPSLDDVPGLRKLAKRGHIKAQYLLYAAYKSIPRKGNGPEFSSDRLVSRAEAEAGLRAAAKQGSYDGVSVLGIALHFGQSLRRNSREALPWLEKYYAEAPKEEQPSAAWVLGDALLTGGNATSKEIERGFTLIDEAVAGGINVAVRSRARAMAKAGNEAGTRDYLETEVKKKNIKANAPLARMLIDGIGGQANIARGLELLKTAHAAKDFEAGMQLAHEHLDGGHLLRDPVKALKLMAPHAENHFETRQELAILLPDHILRLANAKILFFLMKEDEQLKEPEAAWNLLRMLDKRQEDFRDDNYLYKLVERHKYTDPRIELRQSKFDAFFARPGPNQDIFIRSAKKIIDKLIAKNMAAAFTLKGMLQRKGGVYPQDDVAASQNLLKGAKLGDVEAMVEVAKAYHDGNGLARDENEELKWLRMAAALGSIDAKRAIIREFHRNMNITLREGLTEAIALYGDSTGGFGNMLSFGVQLSRTNYRRFAEADTVAAFMDGFRLSSAAAQGNSMLYLQRTVPKWIWILVETVLVAEGFFKGPPEGHFSPDARAALNKWIVAKGPLPAE